MLRPGGLFANLEVVQCASEQLQHRFYDAIGRPGGDPEDRLAPIEPQLVWMREAGLRIGLKSVLMTLNQHEMTMMEQMAQEWGIKFRYDSAIFPCLPNRSEAPLDLRVPPARASGQSLLQIRPSLRSSRIPDRPRPTDGVPADRRTRSPRGSEAGSPNGSW